MVFPLRCNGILIDLPDNLDGVVNDLMPQVFFKSLSHPANREKILGNICDLLGARDGTEHFLVELLLIRFFFHVLQSLSGFLLGSHTLKIWTSRSPQDLVCMTQC